MAERPRLASLAQPCEDFKLCGLPINTRACGHLIPDRLTAMHASSHHADARLHGNNHGKGVCPAVNRKHDKSPF